MLSSDLQTLTLADLFQWLDQSRKSGLIEFECENEPPLWLRVVDRTIVEASRPAETMPGLKNLSGWSPSMDASALWPAHVTDRVVDLFVAPGTGRYTFTLDSEDEARGPGGGVPVELQVTAITLEGMRRLDEWPDLERAYPDETRVLEAKTGGFESVEWEPGMLAVLEAARRGLSIAEARLGLGLSRPAMLRRIDSLHERGALEMEGVSRRADPVSVLIDKAQALMRENQFDEAGLVFKSLLAADPADRRVRLLLREAEREQVAALYEELTPFAVPVVVHGDVGPENPLGRRLTAVDREVLGRINGRWDVASIALASALREVETLKALRKMARLGIVELRNG
jgi:hypothetical protein